jgi:hypothetical protein
MRLSMCVLGVVVATACAAPEVRLSEGMPNTLVVVNQTGAKAIVYDLRGEWANREGTITITQDGAGVEASWKEYTGCCSCRIGHRWFKGTIEGNQVNGLRYLCLSPRFELLSMQITDGGDAFYIEHINVDRRETLEFKRLK